MRADELMIGDWYSWEAEGKKYYYQVTKETFSSPDYDIYNFQPIPLTAEILEKNGMKPFEVDKQTAATAKWWHKGGDFYVKQYHFKHHNFKPTYSFGCNNHTLIEGIEYVHQLQHALKLCGIGIKIKL